MKNMSLSAIITVDQKQVQATAGTTQTSSGTRLIRDRLPNHATGEVRGRERVTLQHLAQEHLEHARTKLERDARTRDHPSSSAETASPQPNESTCSATANELSKVRTPLAEPGCACATDE